MIKRLSKHGNSLALVIDRPILDLLKIDEESDLNVATDGRTLIISPVQDSKRRQKFEAALADTNKRFAKTLRKLAE
jgi:antitoxin component of MazEF toxin-antitoxin module